MVQFLHDLGLSHGVFYLMICDELFLRHRFHRINHACLLSFNFEHFSEGAFTKGVKDIEVAEFQAFLR